MPYHPHPHIIINLINWLQRFYRITMSLKRPFVPKSDVKQWFTTTIPTHPKWETMWNTIACRLRLTTAMHELSEWILLYITFCQTCLYLERRMPDVGTMLYSWLDRMTSQVLYSAQYYRQHCTLQDFGTLYRHNLDDTYPTRLYWETSHSRNEP